ncbi:MAG: ATP-binding domain-containing protein, partial [Desulfobacterales bacterium]
LVTAVRLTATLILVGDVYQLPPVGPGAALADIIGSGNIPVFRLERIFRQQRESPIVVNAHRVREGRPPIFGSSDSLDDRAQFVMIESHRLRTAVDVVVDLCTRRIPEHFHLHPSEDIQVITPMHKGEVGTVHLNQVLQRTLNPPRPGDAEWKGFRAGDKVMHLKNNYAKEVFNGDIGVVFSVSPSQERITVGFEGREIPYDISEIDDLALAYAVSIHKSQGSEYPAVIIPMVTQHYPLLQRNLLYTAITRGRRLVVIVGTKKAVAIALNNDKPRRRMSSLCSRLGGVP